jgi:hypothetical protein
VILQIVSGLPFALNLTFPAAIGSVLHAFTFVNFSAAYLGSPQCYFHFDYVDKMVFITVSPMVVIAAAILIMLVHYAHHQMATNDHPPHSLISRYVTFIVFITYLVLPSVSTHIFGIFSCASVDPGNVLPGTPTFLRNDYR